MASTRTTRKRNDGHGQLSNPELRALQKKTYETVYVIETYVQMILGQADLKLTALPNLPGHQKTAREHALKWHNDYKSLMTATLSYIIGSANQFNSFYDGLVKFAQAIPTDPTAKDSLIDGLKILLLKVQDSEKDVKEVHSKLNEFYRSLQEDRQNFQTDVNEATVKIEGEGGEIELLSKQLDAIHEGMESDIAAMAGGAVGILGGIAMILFGAISEIPSGGASTVLIGGGVLIFSGGVACETIGALDYSGKIKAERDIREKLKGDQIELVALKSAKTHIIGFVNALSTALTAVGSLQQGWSSLDADFLQLIGAVEIINPDLPIDWLMAELETAKADWETTLELALQLQPDGEVPSECVESLEEILDNLQSRGQA